MTTVTLPFTFVQGTLIDANQMNADFTAVVNGVQASLPTIGGTVTGPLSVTAGLDVTGIYAGGSWVLGVGGAANVVGPLTVGGSGATISGPLTVQGGIDVTGNFGGGSWVLGVGGAANIVGPLTVGGTGATISGPLIAAAGLNVTGIFEGGPWMLGVGRDALIGNNITAAAFITASDPRLKKDIATAPDGAVDKVLALPIHNYHHLEENDSAPLHWGVVAAEVRSVMGDNFAGWLQQNDPDRTEGVSYGELTAVLWKAVQEVIARVKALEASQ